jgi:hypothetical protein
MSDQDSDPETLDLFTEPADYVSNNRIKPLAGAKCFENDPKIISINSWLIF